jgi:hypothetical protein
MRDFLAFEEQEYWVYFSVIFMKIMRSPRLNIKMQSTSGKHSLILDFCDICYLFSHFFKILYSVQRGIKIKYSRDEILQISSVQHKDQIVGS